MLMMHDDKQTEKDPNQPEQSSEISNLEEALIDEEELIQLFKNQSTIDPYTNKVVKAKSEFEGRPITLFGFPNRERAARIELKWHKKVIHKFFRVGEPLAEGKQSTAIFNMVNNCIEQKHQNPIPIQGYSRRSFIIAMSKILTHYGEMPELIFMLGMTKIKLTRVNSVTQRQKGNFKMGLPIMDIAYGEGCINRLANFIMPKWDRNPDNPQVRYKKFLEIFKERLATMEPFSHLDLNKYGNILIGVEPKANESDKKTQNNLHLLNGLLFLVTTVEILVRFYRQANGDLFPYSDQSGIISDAFPVAIAQARSLFLLLNGQISYKDFFGETLMEGYDHKQHRAYFGAVTGKGTMNHLDIMFEKLFAINMKYNAFISTKDVCKDFCDTYTASNPHSYFVEGRSIMYCDLKFACGTGNESSEPRDYSHSEDEEISEVVSYLQG